jgi:hypothetical protein
MLLLIADDNCILLMLFRYGGLSSTMGDAQLIILNFGRLISVIIVVIAVRTVIRSIVIGVSVIGKIVVFVILIV